MYTYTYTCTCRKVTVAFPISMIKSLAKVTTKERVYFGFNPLQQGSAGNIVATDRKKWKLMNAGAKLIFLSSFIPGHQPMRLYCP